MKPSKEIDIKDPQSVPPGYGSHHLSWDEKKQRWTLRVTVDMGAKFVGKRLCIRFRAPDQFVACVKRDAMIEALKAIGLSIRPRLQKSRKCERDMRGDLPLHDMKTDTPETDAEIMKILINCGVVDSRNVPEDLVKKSRILERERDLARDHLAVLLAFVLEDLQFGMTPRGYREAVENACALLGIRVENAADQATASGKHG